MVAAPLTALVAARVALALRLDASATLVVVTLALAGAVQETLAANSRDDATHKLAFQKGVMKKPEQRKQLFRQMWASAEEETMAQVSFTFW